MSDSSLVPTKQSDNLGFTGSEMNDYRRQLKKNARRMMGDKVRTRIQSSDLIHETLVFAISRISTIIGKPKKQVYRWMVNVMRYRLLRHVSQMDLEKLYQQYRVVKPIEFEDQIGEDLINAELKVIIMERIGRMDKTFQAIFHLRYRKGLEFSEIAKRIGKTESAVRSVHGRGLKLIKSYLEKKMK